LIRFLERQQKGASAHITGDDCRDGRRLLIFERDFVEALDREEALDASAQDDLLVLWKLNEEGVELDGDLGQDDRVFEGRVLEDDEELAD